MMIMIQQRDEMSYNVLNIYFYICMHVCMYVIGVYTVYIMDVCRICKGVVMCYEFSKDG